MFSFLGKKFGQIYDSIRGIKTVDEESMKGFFETVKYSLIEADVTYSIIDEIIKLMKERCFGTKLSKKLLPEEFVSKQLLDVVTQILGGNSFSRADILSKINESILNRKNDQPIIVALAGLQGSGKTTAISKLIYRLLNKVNKNIDKSLIATATLDYDRPAAQRQLEILSERQGIEMFKFSEINNAIDAAKQTVKEAKEKKKKVVFVDLAGRVSSDENMMNELQEVSKILNTENIFLVIDSMMGQEGLKIAEDFSKKISLCGVIVTKTDSEAPGGVILGITKLLNLSIKYISTGEKPEDFAIFDPKRAAERILGFGDIIALAEAAEEKIAESEGELIKNAINRGDLNVAEYMSIMDMIDKMGSIKGIMGMMPRNMLAGQSVDMNKIDEIEKMNKKFRYMSNSMTKKEKQFPDVFLNSKSRILRISKGAGISLKEAELVLNYYNSTRAKMKEMKGMLRYFM